MLLSAPAARPSAVVVSTIASAAGASCTPCRCAPRHSQCQHMGLRLRLSLTPEPKDVPVIAALIAAALCLQLRMQWSAAPSESGFGCFATPQSVCLSEQNRRTSLLYMYVVLNRKTYVSMHLLRVVNLCNGSAMTNPSVCTVSTHPMYMPGVAEALYKQCCRQRCSCWLCHCLHMLHSSSAVVRCRKRLQASSLDVSFSSSSSCCLTLRAAPFKGCAG